MKKPFFKKISVMFASDQRSILFLLALAIFTQNFQKNAKAKSLHIPQGFSYGFKAGYISPLGAFDEYLDPGYSIALESIYKGNQKNIFFDYEINFQHYIYTNNPLSQFNIYSFAAGAYYHVPLYRWFSPYIGAGLSYNFITVKLEDSKQNANTYKPGIFFKTGFFTMIIPSIWLRFSGELYANELSQKSFLNYQFNASTLFRFNTVLSDRSYLSRKESLVKIISSRLEPIFLAKGNVYKEKGIGYIWLENQGRYSMKNIRVETTVDKIADKPSPTNTVRELQAGEKIKLKVPLLLNRNLSRFYEMVDLSINFRVAYQNQHGTFSYRENETILVYPITAISWQDTSNIGSFITPNDQNLENFSRQAMLQFRDLKSDANISDNMQIAVYLINYLRVQGIRYIRDPDNGYWMKTSEDLSEKSDKLNFLDKIQFPITTLKQKSGDCDDLTALLASMLESLGIRTSIATIPGHIFLLMDTNVPEWNYFHIHKNKKRLVFYKSSTWIPIESTQISEGFLSAWEKASEHINKYQNNGLQIKETREIWTSVPPTDFRSDEKDSHKDKKLDSLLTVMEGHKAEISKLFQKEMQSYKRATITRYLTRNQSEMDKEKQNTSGNNTKDDLNRLNLLGILYSQMGKLEKSKEVYEKILQINKESTDALIHLGHIAFLQKRYTKAKSFYEKVLKIQSNHIQARVSLAQLHYTQGEFEKAKTEYQNIVYLDRKVADKYRYLVQEKGQRSKGPETLLPHAYELLWIFKP